MANETISEKKPLILSVETSGTTCGIALSQGEELLADYSFFGRNLHDRLAAEYIRRIMDDAGITPDELDAVAVSSGPGSFTGLRIGGSIAKGLCFDDKPKLISVPTMAAIASYASMTVKAINAVDIITVINSHKDMLYYQVFDPDGNETGEIVSTVVAEFEKIDLKKRLLAGPGASQFNGGIQIPELNTLSPRFTAGLAYKYYLDKIFTKAEDFTPVYVQDFSPKLNRKKLDI